MKRTDLSLKLISIILVSMIVSCKSSKNWEPQPLIPGMEVQFNTFTINSQADTTLLLPNGTSIFIPGKCFKNSKEAVVIDSVTILYREFHDAVDIMLSGIPMEFISMGEKRYFSTAGMFEIDAKAKGEKLSIVDGKSIRVRMASKYAGDNYSFFYLNPQNGSWEWVDLPATEVNTIKMEAKAKLDAKKPPMLLSENYFALDYGRLLDIMANDDYKKVMNLRKNPPTEKLKEYKIKIYDVNWRYEIQFGRAYYDLPEMLWKDLDGKTFPKWLKNFFPKWERGKDGKWYMANFSARQLGGNVYEIKCNDGNKTFEKRMEAVMPMKSFLRLPASEWQKRYDEAMAQLAEEQQKIDLMAETYRTYSVNRLGIYNFDYLQKLNNWFKVNPIFMLDGQKVTGDVFIVFSDNSGFVNLKPNEYNEMRINPQSLHRILMVLPDKTFGVYPVEKLSEIDVDELAKQETPNLTFTLESKKIKDAVELRSFLGF